MFYHDSIMFRQNPLASGHYVMVVVLGMVVGMVLSLVLTKRQRKAGFDYVISWVPLVAQGRRISTSKTPPRSVSPERKEPTNVPSPVDYKNMFPPSCRETLANIGATLPHERGAKLEGKELNQVEFQKGLIPFAADYRECGPSFYSPTELSVEEIKALGDFPDYAELSGVPLPEAYQEFKIETALSRPYRPLRWAYHQTMCRQPFFACCVS